MSIGLGVLSTCTFSTPGSIPNHPLREPPPDRSSSATRSVDYPHAMTEQEQQHQIDVNRTEGGVRRRDPRRTPLSVHGARAARAAVRARRGRAGGGRRPLGADVRRLVDPGRAPGGLRRAPRAHGVRFVLVLGDGEPAVRRIFELTGLLRRVPVCAPREAVEATRDGANERDRDCVARRPAAARARRAPRTSPSSARRCSGICEALGAPVPRRRRHQAGRDRGLHERRRPRLRGRPGHRRDRGARQRRRARRRGARRRQRHGAALRHEGPRPRAAADRRAHAAPWPSPRRRAAEPRC